MENVVIIGGGPAGLASAIYLARAGLEPLLFAGSPPGGQLTLTSEVENYPGYESVLGAELVEKMRKQAIKFGTKIIDQNISKVDFSGSPFKIYPEGGKWKMGIEAGQENRNNKSEKNLTSTDEFPNSPPNQTSNFLLSKSIVIATGAKALWLGLESETRLRGKGVSACATCDGFFFREKIVAVLGGGDTAFEEALTLTKFAKKVYLIHRRDSFRASKIMQERVKANSKIEIICNAIVEEIMGENRVDGIKLRILDPRLKIVDKTSKIKDLSSKINDLKLDGVFVAIGHKPDTEIFKDKVILDDKGYIITSARKSLDNAKFLINLISNQAPNSNNKKLGNGNLLGQLDQLEIRNYNLNYQTATSVPGVFAAGDCVDNKYRQAAVASGMGVSTALEVEKYLEQI